MTMRKLFAALLTLLPAIAGATTLTVQVRGGDGRPLAGAVVQVSTPRAAPLRPLTGATMAQRDINFDPHVVIVPVGSTVSFPNMDRVRHHVYSFSRPKRFELKLYGRDETRSVLFDKPGIVALGCNIHDSMSGFVAVVDTPYAALSDAQGRLSFADLPAGPATVTVWHPSVRAPGNQFRQPITLAGAGMTASLAPPR